jgi:hypothetical protein
MIARSENMTAEPPTTETQLGSQVGPRSYDPSRPARKHQRFRRDIEALMTLNDFETSSKYGPSTRLQDTDVYYGAHDGFKQSRSP